MNIRRRQQRCRGISLLMSLILLFGIFASSASADGLTFPDTEDTGTDLFNHTNEAGIHEYLAASTEDCTYSVAAEVYNSDMLTVTGAVYIPNTNWNDYPSSSFNGGTGTTDDPYQIATAGQLAYLAALCNDVQVEDMVNPDPDKPLYAQKAYRITDDIDLSGHLWPGISSSSSRRFSGDFNGGDHIIEGMIGDFSGSYGSLLGYIENATVKNVHLSNILISGPRNIAGIAGRANECIIENCTVTGSIRATDESGSGAAAGIVMGSSGGSSLMVSRCAFSGIMEGLHVYGISGSGTSVDQCFVDAELIVRDISLNSGLGISGGDSVTNCYSIGSITVAGEDNSAAAGITERRLNTEKVENCYSTMGITAYRNIGGIAGEIIYSSNGTSDDESPPVLIGCVALNPFLAAGSAESTDYTNRVAARTYIGNNDTDENMSDIRKNYAYSGMKVFADGILQWISKELRTETSIAGADITLADLEHGWLVEDWDSDIWNLEPGKLPTLKNVSEKIPQSGEIPAHITAASEEIWNITAFEQVTIDTPELTAGCTEEEAAELLPDGLFCTKDGTTAAWIPGVEWVCSNFDGDTPGEYTFTAIIPEDYNTTAAAPDVIVSVVLIHTVTFDTKGGNDIDPVLAADGSRISQPNAPIRQSYVFSGWYKESTLTEPWDFVSDTVTEDLTLYAKWSMEGIPDYTAVTAGVQTDDNIDLSKFPATSVIWISTADGVVDGAVVEVDDADDTMGSITFTVPEAGDYIYTFGKLLLGATMTGTSASSDDIVENAYGGSGTGTDPWVAIADFTHYIKDSNIFGMSWLCACNWAGYYAPSGQLQTSEVYDESLARNVIFETRDKDTGKLLASINLDGTNGQRKRIKIEEKAPFTLSFRINPTDEQILNWLDINTLYTDEERKSQLKQKAEEAVDGTGRTLIMFDEARELFGPVTFKLSPDLHGFSAGDELCIEYMGGTGGGQYHGTIPPLDERLDEEMTYLKYYIDTITVAQDGYLELTLFNRGMFQLYKASDDSVISDKYLIFESNGGSLVPPVKVVSGAAAEPDPPTRKDCIFGGWYGDEGLAAVYDFSTDITENTVVYAKWTETGGEGGDDHGEIPEGTYYTVTFETGNDPDSGSPNATLEEQSVLSGEEAEEPGFFNSGYGFLALGWYTDSELENEYDFDSPVVSDITLYPEWMRFMFRTDFKNEGGSGTKNSPYLALLADSIQSKITWKTLNELAGRSEWWQVYVTDNNKPGGDLKFKWVLNGEEIEECGIAQPYYTDIKLKKESENSVRADFMWRTAIEGKVYVSINVSRYFEDGSEVKISYVDGSCDGKEVHADAESGEWVDSQHQPSVYYTTGNSVVKNRLVTLELTHGGSYLLETDESDGSGENMNSDGVQTIDQEGGNDTDIPQIALIPEIEAKNGIASVFVEEVQINELLARSGNENADAVVIAPKVAGQADKVIVELDRLTALNIVDKAAANLIVKTDIASVTIPPGILSQIVGMEGAKIGFSVEKTTGDAVKIGITMDEKSIQGIEGVKIAVPWQGAGKGLVPVILHVDGTEEVIRKSILEDGMMLAMIDGSATIRLTERKRSYNDVGEEFWGKDAVDFAVSRELFYGVSETEFAPDEPISRGMLAAVLHRLENTPYGTESYFDDVDKDSWYSKAAAWAAGNGIVPVTGEGFEPEDHITREQTIFTVYNYAEYLGIDTHSEEDTLTYSDGNQISDWAVDAVKWAAAAGILAGSGQNIIDPKGDASRAMMAAFTQRFVSKLLD